MDLPYMIGLTGSMILISGAAYPIKPVKHPAQSLKNWLYAIGGAFMLAYSIISYQSTGSIFFVFLQILVNVAGLLMLLKVKKQYASLIIGLGGTILVGWSLTLFEDLSTFFFIIGLISISFGYILDITSLKRYQALAIGSTLVSIFSYLQGDMIFFGLNAFFAVLSIHTIWLYHRTPSK